MLSYQHLYHAGNPADVHKHALLAWMLARLTDKPKPMSYIETHAGRGVYDLSAPEALKTGEAAAGVGRMLARFAPDHPYRQGVQQGRAEHGAMAYPGSPLFAATLLRAEDRLTLADLHPQEHGALRGALRGRAQIRQMDGFELALSVCPPTPRRGLLLIDPSYEVKADYETIPKVIAQLHRAWNVGVIALWYPILTDGRHRGMVQALERAGMAKVLRHEVGFPPVRPGHGMVGSGLVVVNTPFRLEEEAARIGSLFGGMTPIA